MDETLRALNHFGLGARPGERVRIGEPRAWLRAQLEGTPPALDATSLVSSKEIAAAIASSRGQAVSDMERRMARARLVQIALGENRAALAHRAASDRPFVERLVAFWSNHFCVSGAGKQLVAPLAGSYERQAIRPHVLGRFEDMVLASAKHPAMLVYLDNFQSIGPASPAVQRGAAVQRGSGATRRGLNENYARELLELHTLGVNGGYKQDDVLQVARILTGWTVAGIAGPAEALTRAAAARPRVRAQLGVGAASSTSDDGLAFVFREMLHEPGPKTALGKVYREADVREGEDLIRDLCRHPSTARFIATKLATHFVADDPPPAAIDRLATVFSETNGDLRALSGALIDLDPAWTAPTRKFRTPQDWLVAVVRAFGGVQGNDPLVQALRQLRHPMWAPPSPKGFPDTAREWADPDSLLNRAELARTLTTRLARRNLDPRSLLEVIETAPGDPLQAMLSDSSIPVAERLALGIAGPAFQWR